MTIIHGAVRERLTPENSPPDCPASSAGMFVIRADGTARFDRHHHDIGEFWFVARGIGTVHVGGTDHLVGPGDIVYTPAGAEHDVVDVAEELHVFWLSAPLTPGTYGAHLHRDPAAARHLVPVVARRP
ncbi:cupin domain-containing protein [Streptosporangium sp. KLBMP 9127]|nr:cupin domain-containing protein [Streptosporangium sp. KLBMP 9127]